MGSNLCEQSIDEVDDMLRWSQQFTDTTCLIIYIFEGIVVIYTTNRIYKVQSCALVPSFVTL